MKPAKGARSNSHSCRAIERKLWDYGRGRLEPDEVAQVTIHLEICEPCRAEAEAYQVTTEIIEAYRVEIIHLMQRSGRSE